MEIGGCWSKGASCRSIARSDLSVTIAASGDKKRFAQNQIRRCWLSRPQVSGVQALDVGNQSAQIFRG